MNQIKLPRRRRYALYLVSFGLWLSGAVWLVAHYWLVRKGDYGPVTSPVEPWSLDLHGGFAMLALCFAGLLWGVHVVNGWRARRGRWSGGLLLALLAVLAVTGYLLYYVGDEDVRAWTSVAHWAVGLATLPAFFWHRLGRKARKANGSSRLA